MTENYPYVSTNYLSSQYRPQELTVCEETVARTTPTVMRDEAEILVILEGAVTLALNGHDYPLAAGQVVQLLPYHVRRLVVTGAPVRLYRIRFSLGLLLLGTTQEASYLAALQDIGRFVPIIALKPRQQAFLAQFCAEVAYEQVQRRETGSLNLALISYVMALYQSQAKSLALADCETAPYRYLKYLQLHHQAELTLPGVAAAFGVPAASVEAALKQATGYGFGDLLDQVRIRNAVGLLQFQGLSLRQIAAVCGYTSVGQFGRRFARLRGCTPAGFRRTLAAEQQVIGQSAGWTSACYVFAHCCEPLTLPGVAAVLHCSEDALARDLTALFGLSFKPLVTFFRCQIGRLLLQATDWPVATIARRVGYDSGQTFARNFRKLWGQTPKQAQLAAHRDA